MATSDLQRLQRLREYLQQGGPLAVTPLDVVDMLHEYINMVREPVPQVIPPGEKLLNLRLFEADEAARRRQLDLMERELALREKELNQRTDWQTLLQQTLNEEVSESALRQQKLRDYIAMYLDTGKMKPQQFWDAMLKRGYTEDELREAFWEAGYGNKIPKTATKSTRASSNDKGTAQLFYAMMHPTESTKGAVSFTPKAPDIRVAASKLLDEIRTAKSLSDAFSRLVSPVREAISNLGRTLLNPFSRR